MIRISAVSLSRSSLSTTARCAPRSGVYSPTQPQPFRLENRLFSSAKSHLSVPSPVGTQPPPPHTPSLSFFAAWRRRFSSNEWKRFSRMVRYTRIPFLVLSVYGLGYQQGIIDHSRDPGGTRQALLDDACASVGVTDRGHVHAARDGEAAPFPFPATGRPKTHPQARRIARVGRSIIAVARKLVREEMTGLAVDLRATLPTDITEEQFGEALLENEDFAGWYKAKVQLDGNWTYMLLETPVPNAFVTEMLPKHIFVTIAMLDMVENDDELALVLGHEVSHLILGHVSQRNVVETVLRTVEVLLLSLDPTEGALSLAVVGVLAASRRAVAASFSRDHERQADDLGIRLAARACYDTRRAARVFERLHEREEAPRARFPTLADSHPPSRERYEDLMIASETENAASYSHCASVKKKLQEASGGTAAGWFR